MKQPNNLQVAVFLVLFAIGVSAAYSLYTATGEPASLVTGLAALLVALFAAAAIQVANQWEKAVVLHLGRYKGLFGPGVFTIVPLVETVAYWIDTRIITTSFTAEKTLTKDTVPVDVEAVLFWRVVDPERAALLVEDYRAAVSWAAQTALREVIGRSLLAEMLEGREKLDLELQRIIEERAEQWGIHVSSVEIRDVLIPAELQDAMSMQAQAERERQARVILGDSERQVAEKFEEAARTYQNNPTALHLRAMNMLYEGLKEKATLVIVPSTVLDTMTLGDTSGVIALSRTLGGQQQPAAGEGMKREKEKEKEAPKPAGEPAGGAL
ncbi:MAG TPA: slipin family protein [Methanolinea sp.]|jgi:regulator of protease activity HflC (stomatin/prohibitin superfamily)|nr:slipin family protein [Methanolinea sp.]HQJ18159.1 slipin family protein [Methanolinea sp.]HRS92611.1 slipin family protein [Methanolinea sp.]HRU78897.1 slipin family protein [Methanolinea sp.]